MSLTDEFELRARRLDEEYCWVDCEDAEYSPKDCTFPNMKLLEEKLADRAFFRAAFSSLFGTHY